MKLRRLRSRLIASFLGVALLAMIPLVIVPYYLLYVSQYNEREHLIEATDNQLSEAIDNLDNQIQNEILMPSVRYLRSYLNEYPSFQAVLRNTSEADAAQIQQELRNREEGLRLYLSNERGKNLDPSIEISILTQAQYQARQDWLQQGLYYEENNVVYLWSNKPIPHGDNQAEMEIIGAVFVKRPFIIKPSGQQQKPQLVFDFGSVNPNVRVMALTPNPNDLENYLPEQALTKLFNLDGNGGYQEVNLAELDMPTFDLELPVQAKLIPILNQENVPVAILSLYIPVTDLWEAFGFHTLLSFLVILGVIILAALIMARSISYPIFQLAGAAEKMSHGNFDVRVPVQGSEEQQTLSQSFNEMAERIQSQMKQLQQKTMELEVSNQELAQTHNFLQNILGNISTGVMSIDRGKRISHVNRVGLEILRLPECNGKKVEDVIESAPFLELINFTLNNSTSVYQHEIVYQLNSGDQVPLQVSTVPLIESNEIIGLVVTFHDLSTIRRLEEQVRRQERLAGLGSMVAGVAHEIRNPLGIIRGSAQILKKRFAHFENEEGLSEFIIDEVNRLSRVVNDFLMFARPPVPTIEAVRVDEMIEQVLAYTHDQENAELISYTKEIPPDLPTIGVDMDLCRQVFLNLLINAQDAMEEGGEIIIRARQRNRQEIAIEIIDQGSGIEPEKLERIFDPFFTSKDSGTGLGLSLVHQIMSSHEGKIEAESTPGQGSTFRVIFPVYQNQEVKTDTHAGIIEDN